MNELRPIVLGWQTGLLGGVLVVLLGVGAFFDGLYSPGQQLIPTILLGLTVLACVRKVDLTRGEVLGLLLIGFGLLTAAFQPAAATTAAHGPAIVAGWSLAFLLGRRLVAAEWLFAWLGRIWAITASLMVFVGIVTISYLPPHHSGRLASLLGYPIAVGVLGMMGIAGALATMASGRKWGEIALFGSSLGLILSGSRGVWGASALLLLYLLWMRPLLFKGAGRAFFCGLSTALWLGPAIAGRDGTFAALAALLGSLTLLAAQWLRDCSHSRRLIWAGWGLSMVLAPGWGWLAGRVSTLAMTDGSVVERFTFLRDGFALASRLPFGAGYRAWSALHLQGASYAYQSAEVHSAVLDLAIGIGWAGAAGFMILLLGFVWGLRHGHNWSTPRLTALAALAAMGLHALLDWELSYALFAIPLWLGFGLLSPRRSTIALPFSLIALLSVSALLAALVVGTADSFTLLAQKAAAKGDYGLSRRHASMATAITPYSDLAHAVYGQALSALGDGEGAIASFARARERGPYEPWYAELHARELVRVGRWPAAAQAYVEFVQLWPWHVPAYEAALTTLMDLSIRASLAGNPALAQQMAIGLSDILDSLDRQKAREPLGAPRKPMAVNGAVIRQARALLRSER